MASKRYSRLSKVEQQKNLRSTVIFITLTITTLSLFFFFGLPTIVKFAAFLTDIRRSNEPVEKNDTTPPVLPRFDPLPEAVNQNHIEIIGQTEPGVTVILFLNGNQEEILANNEGEFTFSFNLDKGKNRISALARDSAGNESQETSVYTIDFDNEPPEIEIASPQNESQFYGSKQRQVVIEGKTEEGVAVRINDRIVVVESDGSFTFTTSLSEGDNIFHIIAEDQAKNTTETELKLKFTS